MPSACHAHTGRPLAGAHGPDVWTRVACTRRSAINLDLHGGASTALWAPAAPAGPCSVATACIPVQALHAGPSAPCYAGRPAACLHVRSITKVALHTRHGMACSAPRVTCTWHHMIPVTPIYSARAATWLGTLCIMPWHHARSHHGLARAASESEGNLRFWKE